MGNTANYAIRYPDKDGRRVAPADFKNMGDDVDALFTARNRSSNLNVPTLQALSRQNGTKAGTLIAETMPWELCVVSCNARASPGGAAPTSQRMTLQAVYLEKGQVITGLQKYCINAYGAITVHRLSLWTYDGTTFTCVLATADMPAGTGFRGSNVLSYTVTTSGIYFAGYIFNGTIGSGTDLQYLTSGLLVVPGDFISGKAAAGFSQPNWPRAISFSGISAATAVGNTLLFSNGVFFDNQPYVAVIGTIL